MELNIEIMFSRSELSRAQPGDDASLVVSCFNFVNRMVLSLGVELEQDEEKN